MPRGLAYLARTATGTDSNTPTGWPYGWNYPDSAFDDPYPEEPVVGGEPPGLKWPDNWPIAVVATTTIVASAPATIAIATPTATIEAELLIGGLNTGTSVYLNHLLQVTCSEAGAVRKLRKSGGPGYVNAIYYKVSNYAGAKYGFSQTIEFDTAEWSVADNIDIQVKLVTATANPSGTDQWSVVS